jgi:hypothetical protein
LRLPIKIRLLWQSDFKGEDFSEIDQLETKITCGGHICYRGPSIDVSYQVSIHLTKWFQRRRFLEMYQSETRIACGGDVYSQNQDEMGNLYRGPSIDASYQVSFHLAMRFQRRFFRNRPIRNRRWTTDAK